jgi:ethanolamine utilization protein EutQ (cupin superfamily)
MKIYKKEYMDKNLLDDHGYDDTSNISKYSALDIFGEMGDKKILACYWWGPKGSWMAENKDFGEIGLVISGELELTKGSNNVTLYPGDAYYFKKGEKARFNVKKLVKLFVVAFPIEEEQAKFFEKVIKDNKG